MSGGPHRVVEGQHLVVEVLLITGWAVVARGTDPATLTATARRYSDTYATETRVLDLRAERIVAQVLSPERREHEARIESAVLDRETDD